MSKEENNIWLEKYILNNPFDFKQGIINHCRQMDKIDVYEWVAKDELKIQKLQQRIDKAIKFIEENSPNLSNSELYDLLEILKGGEEIE